VKGSRVRREWIQRKHKRYFERALAVARQQQAKSWELGAAMSMGRLWPIRTSG
jgi:hypothetical protein